MFDPFDTFESKGYLENVEAEKDLDVVKEIEHSLFMSNLDIALSYLSQKHTIQYNDFLEVHRILFSDYYPWAGKDRFELTPNLSISKASTCFSVPTEIQRTINYALDLIKQNDYLIDNPGEIMGLFAYAHPFLDGNGRTILLIHTELCHRAGFRIVWEQTSKFDYLTALSVEIAEPRKKELNRYLKPFINNASGRDVTARLINSIEGLDGKRLLHQNVTNKVDGNYTEKEVEQKYKEFEAKRNYNIS
ncbi:Fic family protein [Vibrio sp. 1-Bac 57]